MIFVSFLICQGHTLIIDGKKSGSTSLHAEYRYVREAGYNILGTFVVRFLNGREISLGKRSHWEYFNWMWLSDDDQLIP